jgi:hypothetical protein
VIIKTAVVSTDWMYILYLKMAENFLTEWASVSFWRNTWSSLLEMTTELLLRIAVRKWTNNALRLSRVGPSHFYDGWRSSSRIVCITTLYQLHEHLIWMCHHINLSSIPHTTATWLTYQSCDLFKAVRVSEWQTFWTLSIVYPCLKNTRRFGDWSLSPSPGKKGHLLCLAQ